MDDQYNPFNVKIGEIWIENDPRHYRKVEIIKINFDIMKANIKNLENGKTTWARLDRFNGKRGGYMREKN